MCAPAVAMAALGAGKAVLEHSSAVSAADASNRNKLKAYYARRGQVIGTHYADITTYYHKGVDAEIAWAENALAANRGIQQKIVEIQQKTQEAVTALGNRNKPGMAKAVAIAGKKTNEGIKFADKTIRKYPKSASAVGGAIGFDLIDDA